MKDTKTERFIEDFAKKNDIDRKKLNTEKIMLRILKTYQLELAQAIRDIEKEAGIAPK